MWRVSAIMFAPTVPERRASKVSVIGRLSDRGTPPTQWHVSSKVRPRDLPRIPRALDIAKHYSANLPHTIAAIATDFSTRGAVRGGVSAARATLVECRGSDGLPSPAACGKWLDGQPVIADISVGAPTPRHAL
jgi:hypothetical protein